MAVRRTWRLRPGVEVRSVGNEVVVVDFREGGVFRLNTTGGSLAASLKRGAHEGQLVQCLVRTYGVASERARADVEEFLTVMRECSLLDDSHC